MRFNSISFLASFALLAVVYYTLPHRARWVLLLIASLGFCASFDTGSLLPLAVVTAIAYGGGLAMGQVEAPRPRAILACACIGAVLALLIAGKYLNLVGRTHIGFIGLSFYTFSAVSNLADVYRRRTPAEPHPGYFAVYIAFFPKLLAGPIERADVFLAQLRRPVIFDDQRVVAGLQQMLWGLFKKVVIADRLAAFVDRSYTQAALAAPADLLLATYFFAIQLYCDFSGYSDIAIGASRVLGFDLVDNFRRPYFATFVAEFWSRRWHLSLASWFRDYVYIPLGGNRLSLPRRALNVMLVFLLSGLWHGVSWTFVTWGALNGLYQVIGLVWRRARPEPDTAPRTLLLRRVLTFHLILISWVFFRAASMSDALTIIGRVMSALPALPALLVSRLATPELTLSALLIVFLVLVEAFDERRPVWARLGAAPVALRWATYYGLAAGLLVLGVWNLQSFVYMQF